MSFSHKGSFIRNFNEDEFPEGELEYTSTKILTRMDTLRDLIGSPIYPSPVKGSLARIGEDENSQHYAKEDGSILSKADDWFPFENEKISFVFTACISCGLFGGIGVYFDTHGLRGSHDVMFHTDTRTVDKYEFPTIWFRKNKQYYYPFASHDLMKELFRLIGEADEK